MTGSDGFCVRLMFLEKNIGSKGEVQEGGVSFNIMESRIQIL